MTARAIATAIAVAAVLAGCAEASQDRFDVGGPKVDRGRVVSVTDGDTLRVRIGARSERVRLLGIDTPETRRPGVAVECGGKSATATMRRLVFVRGRGRRVTLTGDSTQDRVDRYARRLAYVTTLRGDVGAAQLRAGWASSYVFGGRPVRRAPRYRRLAAAAKAARRGVWGSCDGDFHRPAH